MCGIAGIFSFNAQPLTLPDRTLEAIRHRGPDDSGQFQDTHVVLGHRRLSIQDTSDRGHQPMTLAKTDLTIVFNGEIYNFIELRSELQSHGFQFITETDTEVLLAAYQHWGVDCLHRFRGVFAFAIWNSSEKTLFLARDRFGEKPFYISSSDEQVFFSSELKAMATMLPARPALNPQAIDLYLHYQFFPEPYTPLLDVTKLPAAHYLLLSPDTPDATPRQYWSFDDIEPVEGEPAELIRDALLDSIAIMLRADVPVGVALSGGIDSGAIATVAAQNYHESMKAFSIGYPGRPAYDERDDAFSLANELGLQFHDTELQSEEFIDFFPDLVSIMDTPIADIAAFGHYAVCRSAAASNIKVILTGIGGDELFWGYDWPPEAVRLTKLKKKHQQSFLKKIAPLFPISFKSRLKGLSSQRKIPASIRTLATKLDSALKLLEPDKSNEAIFYELVGDFYDAQMLTPPLYEKEFAAEIPKRNATIPYRVNLQDEENVPHLICRLLFDGWLKANCLALGDRVSMGCSVEARVPFLDHLLVEKVVGLRKTYDDHDLGNKVWLKKALAGILSDEIMNRPKQGFRPPVEEWRRGVIERYGERLLSGVLVANGIMKEEIKKLLDKHQDDQPASALLYKLILLEIWCTVFFDKVDHLTTDRDCIDGNEHEHRGVQSSHGNRSF